MPTQWVIQNPNVFVIDHPDIYESDGITMNICFVLKFAGDFNEDVGLIFYVILIFQVTKMNIYLTLPITEKSVCIYELNCCASFILLV